MIIIESINKLLYKNKIKSLDVSVETEEDNKFVNALFKLGKDKRGREHQLECFRDTALKIKLQKWRMLKQKKDKVEQV